MMWKTVPNTDGMVEVSKLGEVRRNYKNGKSRILLLNTNGAIHAMVNRKEIEASASRLVWEAFVGEIPEGYVIIKKNCVVTDCRLVNLECVPISRQKKYAKEHQWDCKPVIALNKQTGKKLKFRSIRYCAQRFDIARDTLRKYIETGTPCMGYTFKFVREEDYPKGRRTEK